MRADADNEKISIGAQPPRLERPSVAAHVSLRVAMALRGGCRVAKARSKDTPPLAPSFGGIAFRNVGIATRELPLYRR